ncbi:MAG: hypothetical protein QXI59_07750 [Candidatus Bathyarchaeia archaeon]
MRISVDDLDVTAFIVFAILLASLTSRALLLYKRTFKIEPLAYNPAALLIMVIALILVLLTSSSKIRTTVLAGYIFAFGVYSRALYVYDPSIWADVLPVTKEAVEVILSGGNIYLHIFRSSAPPGQPFKYGPFEPLFYIPFYLTFGDLRIAELFSSTVVMILIFYLGRYAGYAKTLIPLAIYSSWGLNITTTGAGVNDDSGGMLGFLSIFLLILSMRRKSKYLAISSSVVLGLSICFKLFPALLAPFIIILLYNLRREFPLNWKYYLTILTSTIFILSLPYLLVSPEAYLRNLFVANIDRLVEFHPDSYQWHIWASILNRDFFLYLPSILNIDVITIIFMVPKIMIVIFLVTMILLLNATRRVVSLARCISYSIISWFTLLIPGPWFPSSFFGYIAPLICALPILDPAWNGGLAKNISTYHQSALEISSKAD